MSGDTRISSGKYIKIGGVTLSIQGDKIVQVKGGRPSHVPDIATAAIQKGKQPFLEREYERGSPIDRTQERLLALASPPPSGLAEEVWTPSRRGSKCEKKSEGSEKKEPPQGEKEVPPPEKEDFMERIRACWRNCWNSKEKVQ